MSNDDFVYLDATTPGELLLTIFIIRPMRAYHDQHKPDSDLP